jgi:hypothetical protein
MLQAYDHFIPVLVLHAAACSPTACRMWIGMFKAEEKDSERICEMTND